MTKVLNTSTAARWADGRSFVLVNIFTSQMLLPATVQGVGRQRPGKGTGSRPRPGAGADNATNARWSVNSL